MYKTEQKKNPAYLQLYMQMREDIVRGIYPYGSKLPSKRVIAADQGLSTVTVEHAYELLTDEGYIQPRERSGYFVIFRKDDGFAATAPRQQATLSSPRDGQTKSDFPFSVLARTMRSVISEQQERLLERAPNAGCMELRSAIASYLARNRGIIASPEQIVVGSGSEYLYTLLTALLGRERVFAIEAPSYNKIEQVYTAAGICVDKLPLGKDGIESSSLGRTKADVLHITPYRSYPSGVTATASKRHEYLRWAEQENRFIIEDDYESEFTLSKKSEETLFSHTKQDNVIYMNTFSKTVSASFRVGYMVLPKKLTEQFQKELGFYSCTVPTYIQLVLAKLIVDGHFERHINRVRRSARKQLGL